ncbi:bifunctional hydroxymethylpyrimidine kinase/phosphomethylpyrimidine kinase [Aeromicrobium sp. CTD01-1L150]|uniref:bifunctional hydroxymethylpyrimidine kinase/phosphomethylpyrimidine kinase n=1 Tax=Aeromicrobium sp. CTD01-1L150 TaxID=3341830 RepID=UPI0035BF47EF
MSRTPVMLSVAGSDPSGGAGIQADLKTATALGVYAGAVLTALTAQNTTGVQGIHAVPPEFVGTQLESVLTDLDVRAVKIGMLGAPEVAAVVADALRRRPVPAVVLDPVMVASSGDRLVPQETIEVIATELLPLATVVTPNVPEAQILTGAAVDDLAGLELAGQLLVEAGARAALVKGGHLSGAESIDLLVTGEGAQKLAAPRVETPHTHGTGCTLSSAVAAFLVRGEPLQEAVARAKDYLVAALASGSRRDVGAGHGPVDHLGGR